jgi:hypothetical protein
MSSRLQMRSSVTMYILWMHTAQGGAGAIDMYWQHRRGPVRYDAARAPGYLSKSPASKPQAARRKLQATTAASSSVAPATTRADAFIL